MTLRLDRIVLFGILFSTLALLTVRAEAAQGDWPQFRGPNRDGKCAETGLLKQWPAGGPKLLWSLKGLGQGFSTVAIADGRLLTMGDRAADDGKAQFVIAYDLATRKELWATRVGPSHKDGSRCTPTIDGEQAYALGTEGDLVCLETATGKLQWKKSLPDDFGGHMMSVWKFSESPLVDGERLICTPGGKKATIVALDKKTGATIWTCAVPKLGGPGKEGASYASAIVAEIEGVRQYVQLIGAGVVGIDAQTGKYLWGYNRIANPVAVIPNAIVRGNHVFATTSYGAGSALLKITKTADGFKADEVWFNDGKTFENHHGGVVLVGDHLYGGHGRNNGVPKCLDFLTGKIVWEGEPAGKRSAALLYADGNLVYRYEDGVVALVRAEPAGLKVVGRFTPAVVDGPAWPHPVIHQGKLYLRAHDVLMCYEVKAAE